MAKLYSVEPDSGSTDEAVELTEAALLQIIRETVEEYIIQQVVKEGVTDWLAEQSPPDDEAAQAADEIIDILDSGTLDEAQGGFAAQLLKLIGLKATERGIEKEDVSAELAYKMQSRRDLLKRIGLVVGTAAALGTGASFLDYLQSQAALERPAHHASVEDVRGDYGGPHMAVQGDHYLDNYNFEGQIDSIDSFGEGSMEKRLVKYKRAPATDYISPGALLDKPIPKLKSDTGQEAFDYLQANLDGSPDKVKYLFSVYRELLGIGQVGLAGAESVQIKVKDGGEVKTVLPPEWSILFTFLTNSLEGLDEAQMVEFKGKIDKEEIRKHFDTPRGQKQAVDHGYELGKAGGEIDQTSVFFSHQPELVAMGYEAGIAGEKNPGIPRR